MGSLLLLPQCLWPKALGLCLDSQAQAIVRGLNWLLLAQVCCSAWGGSCSKGIQVTALSSAPGRWETSLGSEGAGRGEGLEHQTHQVLRTHHPPQGGAGRCTRKFQESEGMLQAQPLGSPMGCALHAPTSNGS